MSECVGRVTDEQISEALALHEHDPHRWTYVALAKRYSVSYARFYYSLYPDRKEGKNERRRIRKRLLMRRTAEEALLASKSVQTELRKRLRAIPRDSRDFTSQFCGDPLPGRSALDQRTGKPVDSWDRAEKPYVPSRCVWRFGG